MTDYKTICVPRTVCKQVPVEVCVKVPVVVHCPPVVLPSSQSVMASSQSVPFTTVPPCDPCDSRYPLVTASSASSTEPPASGSAAAWQTDVAPP